MKTIYPNNPQARTASEPADPQEQVKIITQMKLNTDNIVTRIDNGTKWRVIETVAVANPPIFTPVQIYEYKAILWQSN